MPGCSRPRRRASGSRPAGGTNARTERHRAFPGTHGLQGHGARGALQIAEEIEDVGGYINAYTSREMTAYYARVLADDVPLALDVIADIVLNPAFRKAEIETERHVILQEIGQALDTPDDIIFDWLHEVSLSRPALRPHDPWPGRAGFGLRKADLRASWPHYAPTR
jgi:predicted Zn-dependent peptidase